MVYLIARLIACQSLPLSIDIQNRIYYESAYFRFDIVIFSTFRMKCLGYIADTLNENCCEIGMAKASDVAGLKIVGVNAG